MTQRIAGLIQIKVNGVTQDAKGEFTAGYGTPKRTAIVGSDGKIHGFKEEGQVPYVEGTITDRGSLDLKALFNGTGQTVTADIGNGKTVVLRDCWYAGPAELKTAESEVDVRWEGGSLNEVPA